MVGAEARLSVEPPGPIQAPTSPPWSESPPMAGTSLCVPTRSTRRVSRSGWCRGEVRGRRRVRTKRWAAQRPVDVRPAALPAQSSYMAIIRRLICRTPVCPVHACRTPLASGRHTAEPDRRTPLSRTRLESTLCTPGTTRRIGAFEVCGRTASGAAPPSAAVRRRSDLRSTGRGAAQRSVSVPSGRSGGGSTVGFSDHASPAWDGATAGSRLAWTATRWTTLESPRPVTLRTHDSQLA
jgi:hypothetical protein